MTRFTQRQLVDAMKRAIERSSHDAAERYGIKKKSKAVAKPKAKSVSKVARKTRAAAE